MLAAFITGISFGSALLSRYEGRIRNVFFFFGITQIVTAIIVAVVLPFYPYVVWIFEQWGKSVLKQSLAFYPYEAGKFLICFAVMLVPTIFIGMALPLLVKLVNDQMNTIGFRSGLVYSANTIGNVVGALLGGLFLLPLLGMERSLPGQRLQPLFWESPLCRLQKKKKEKQVDPFCVRFDCFSLCVLFAFRFLETGMVHTGSIPTLTEVHTLAEKRKLIDRYEVLHFKDDPAGHVLVARTKNLKPEASPYTLTGRPMHLLPVIFQLKSFSLIFHFCFIHPRKSPCGRSCERRYCRLRRIA